MTTEFDRDYFERLRAAASHWWVEGMHRIGRTLLAETRTNLDVLDAGCGSGASIPWLATLAAPRPVQACDVARAGIDACVAQGLPARVLVASVTHLPYPHDRFDVVLSADVLQHLPERGASAALTEIRRVLRPGGTVLLRTNAACGRAGVATREDWRLYSRDALAGQIGAAGLRVERITYANVVESALAGLRRRSRTPQHHDHGAEGHGLGIPAPVHPVKNAIGRRLLAAEARLLRRRNRSLPFGHTLFAVAVKPT